MNRLRLIVGLTLALCCQPLSGCDGDGDGDGPGTRRSATVGADPVDGDGDGDGDGVGRLEIATGEPDPRSTWCEPLTLRSCSARQDDDRADHLEQCGRDPDGTPMKCWRNWWDPEGPARVCSSRPASRFRKKHRAVARAVFDHLGLSRPVRALIEDRATKGSSWRPWKRHRLSVDVESSIDGWRRHRDKLREAGNIAAGDPDRWAMGLGLLEQQPVYWLRWWDLAAPPETLCGVPEAILVYVRAMRHRLKQLDRGVWCDGENYHGGGGRPSLYDLRLVHSGRTCPRPESSKRREQWASRMAARGVDPYGEVTRRDLGRVIDRTEQDAVADELRVAVPR